jgi:hypothetical protein
MNQRIAKLYDRSLAYFASNGDYVAGELDPEKFAELIIQECIDIIAPYMLRKYADGGVEMHDPGRPLHHPIMEIKEHFGMK